MLDQLYKHYKGNFYRVVGTALHSETKDELIIYRCVMTGSLWARPKAMFEGGVVVDGKLVARFKKVDHI